MKGSTTLRRFKDAAHIDRSSKATRARRHAELSAWQRARYEQAPEMITHMLQVR